MTITLELKPDEEAFLLALCQSQGIEPAAYVHRVIRQSLDRDRRHEKNQAAIALLKEWMDEELPEAESDQEIASWEERTLARGSNDLGTDGLK